jgi:hypothetical protein
MRIKTLGEQQKKDTFAECIVDLTNALDEWKNAGADSLSVVGAIQRLVYAINNQEKK